MQILTRTRMIAYWIGLFVFSTIGIDGIEQNGFVWPKLLISNDGKDIRLAEPRYPSNYSMYPSSNFYAGHNHNQDYGESSDQSISINNHGDRSTSQSTSFNANFNTAVGSNNEMVNYYLSPLYEYVDYASPFDVDVRERKLFFVRHDPSGKKNNGLSGDKLVSVDVEKPKKPHKVLLKNFFPASDGIAVDWVTKKLYLFDADTLRIEVLDYGMGMDHTKPILAVLIYKNLFVRSLVVDPLSGYMFWLSESTESIERAWMDGTHRRQLIKKTSFPHSLGIDCPESRLYWTIDEGIIWSSNLDGGDRRKIETGQERTYSIAAFENMLMWGDVSEKNPGIYYCDKRSCAKPEILVKKLKPFTLRVYDARRQPERTNPCAVNNGNCSHLCLLTPQLPLQRTCACPIGVKMSEDNLTCTNGPEQVILTAQRSSIRVISLDTPDYTDRRVPIDRIKHAVAIDYSPIDGYVYWLDTALEAIRRVKLDGSNESDVVTGISSQSEDLAVDYIAGNVYWTDAGTGRIEVARIGEPSARRILISTDMTKPRAIVVDPSRGEMYWTDLDERRPRIEKAFLDGSNRLTLVELELQRWPNGLALDTAAGHIYWVDASWDTLDRASAADGSDRRTVIEFEGSHAWGLAVLGDYVYWSDMQHRSLLRSTKTTDEPHEKTLLTENLIDIMRIKGVDLKNLPTGTNECAINNGGCSHLCLYRPTGKNCACPLGWELNANGRQCLQPDGYLVFTKKTENDIMIASLSNFPTNMDSLKLHNVSHPFSLDYYYEKKYLYWTGMDGQGNTMISRAHMNGSQAETIIDYGLSAGESLAIDWISEQMYWSDSGYNHIEVATLDGRSRRILIWWDIVPRDLLVDPLEQHIYFVDMKDNARPTIERAGLDGENCRTFLNDVGRVSSMTLDYHGDASRLYWTSHDPDRGTISYVVLNDENHIRHQLMTERSMQPYGLTLYDRRLYWADWHKQTIEMCDKDDASNHTILYSNQKLVKSLTAVHASKQQKVHKKCGDKRCEHLCFLVQTTHRCECPTHFTISDDGWSCNAPMDFLLLLQHDQEAKRRTIRRLKLASGHTIDGPIATLPQKDVWQVLKWQYDPLNRTIYWLELNETTRIRRAMENSSRVETLITTTLTSRILDFALDVPRRSIYLTMEHKESAMISTSIDAYRFVNEEWTHLGQIVAQSGAHPKWVEVDPLRGYLYYIDYFSSKSSLVRCTPDGKQCRRLIDREDGEMSLLTLDLDIGNVYWYNRERAAIGRLRTTARRTSDGNGGNVNNNNNNNEAYDHDFLTNLPNNRLLSMSIYKDRLYVLENRTNAIWSVDKSAAIGGGGGGGIEGGASRTRADLVPYRRMTGLSAMLLVDEMIYRRFTNQKTTGDCAKCSDVCYVEPMPVVGQMDRLRCGCTLGKMLTTNDGGESSCIDRPKCHPYEFMCQDGECISHRSVCDKKIDCKQDGGSDERNCTCQSRHVTCDGGNGTPKCIPYAQLCDGTRHCADNTQENLCPFIAKLLMDPDDDKPSTDDNDHDQHRPSSKNGSSNHPRGSDNSNRENDDDQSNRNSKNATALETLNVVIYVMVSLATICVAYGLVRWCRSCRRSSTKGRTATTRLGDGTTLELRVLHPAGGMAAGGGAIGGAGQQTATGTTATTTVEYSATCRVIHHGHHSISDEYSSIAPLPPPIGGSGSVADDRPNLTGKSSSSAASSSHHHHHHDGRRRDTQARVLRNPPPSPATVVTTTTTTTTSSTNDDSARRRSPDRDRDRRNRRRRRKQQYDTDRYRGGDQRACCSYHPPAPPMPQMGSPPPPYTACVRELDQDTQRGPPADPSTPLLYNHDEEAEMDRLYHQRYEQDRQQDRRRSHRRRRSSNRRHPHRDRGATVAGASASAGGSRPPPSSPCSSHRYRYENPPPTRNNTSSSESSGGESDRESMIDETSRAGSRNEQR